jgi:6-pyruvoyl-tetrahydropterin synthase
MEERVIYHVDRDGRVSMRHVGEELNVSHMPILRVLHEQSPYPYHLRVQGFMPADFPTRENFCRCFVQRSAEHLFVSSELFTDEARFGRDSIMNIHN